MQEKILKFAEKFQVSPDLVEAVFNLTNGDEEKIQKELQYIAEVLDGKNWKLKGTNWKISEGV